MKILFIGDVFGRPGRELVRRGLPALSGHVGADFVIANVENAAAGFGITRELGDGLLECGIDVMTTGNHVWDKKEALPYLAAEPRILRPANYPAGAPGRGALVARTAQGKSVGVLNLMGRVFMHPLDDPFAGALAQIEVLRASTRVIVVDFHAEATSEKAAMGWHLDGRATAVIGTHTHVQTADERVLPGGTAYITDVGMTGPHDSIIGIERQAGLNRFVTAVPVKFEPATENPRLHAVTITVDEHSGRAASIERISLSLDDLSRLAQKRHPDMQPVER